jgi:hypothetical protein
MRAEFDDHPTVGSWVRMSALSARRSLRPWVLVSVLAGTGAVAYFGVILLGPGASSESVIAGPRPSASGSSSAAGATDRLGTMPGRELALQRPERTCPGLVVLDVQTGADNEIEGAWLATGPSQSPKMVLLGQRFGPGILRRAWVDAKSDLPEVWMQNADGTCRASLPEEELARTLVADPPAPRPGPTGGPLPPATTPADAPSRSDRLQQAHRNARGLARALFATSPKAHEDGAESGTAPEAEPAPAEGGATASAP